ncbi:MAG: glycoside hydrolase family 57 protein [Pseudohongiellaceae bacterium]
MTSTSMRVVFCWHMHQPCYQDQLGHRYKLPWVYLHAIKDYTDMANILESIPRAKAVINFCPVLLEQIEDYDLQIREFLNQNIPLKDELLALLTETALPVSVEDRREIIENCLRANEHRLIHPHKPYAALVDLAKKVKLNEMPLSYLDEQFFFDLLTWYHLAWLGETVRRSDSRVASLMARQTDFTHRDRILLLQIMGELIGNIIPKYRHLADMGQIELSVTPYTHPMLPLLLDTDCAREAEPAVTLPELKYPGGQERVEWQMRKAVESFRHYFGRDPVGCWPSEGGVSEAVLDLLDQQNFKWVASGGNVLHNSLQANDVEVEQIHRAFQLGDNPIRCFFRDDKMSDLIGFTYSDWHGDDAADNLLDHLHSMQKSGNEGGDQVVSIILDGENCWEYYPNNGFYFLTALYKKLVRHPEIKMTTFSECLNEKIAPQNLDKLVAGSWVFGNFSTWLGNPDKNRAWDLLCKAKSEVDRVFSESQLDPQARERIERQLAICEGSDWFWWYGDYNPASSVRDFDALSRLHLSNLYALLGLDAPRELMQVISAESGEDTERKVELHGVMRRSQQS